MLLSNFPRQIRSCACIASTSNLLWPETQCRAVEIKRIVQRYLSISKTRGSYSQKIQHSLKSVPERISTEGTSLEDKVGKYFLVNFVTIFFFVLLSVNTNVKNF